MTAWETAYQFVLVTCGCIPPCTREFIDTKVHWMTIPYWHQFYGPKKEKRA